MHWQRKAELYSKIGQMGKSDIENRFKNEAVDYQENLDEEKKRLASFEAGDYSDFADLQVLISRIANLKSKGDAVVSNKVKCTYTIMNPLVKATQEVTRIFYLSPDNTKVLAAEAVE